VLRRESDEGTLGFVGYMDWVIYMARMAFQSVSPRLEVVHVKGRGHILGNGDV